jgi:F-type H+-transporting ATPase subunit gamma
MQKVMGAMNMIATIKLKKLFGRQEALKTFDKALFDLTATIAHAIRDQEHVLNNPQRTIKRSHVILFTADKGLCGSHNNSVLHALHALSQQNSTGPLGIELRCIAPIRQGPNQSGSS